MGEKVEGQKKDDGAVTVVFKINMHCEGCATKMKRTVKHFQGVKKVNADPASNKLTITGKFDSGAIKSKLEEKFKTKIEIVSAQPKKEGGGDKKSDEKADKKTDGKSEKKSDEKAEKKPEKKSEEKKADEKKPKEITVVLKMRLHCEGCIQKIRKSLIKFKGVNEIKVEEQKDLITVKGAIEGKDLAGFLTGKFKRTVEVVPPKKEGPAATPAAAAGDKKGKDGKGDSGGGAKMEVSKMEYGGYYGGEGHAQYHGYPMEGQASYPAYGFANSSGYYTSQNYVQEGYAMYGNPHHAPQMFSDENPNACSVM